MVLRTIFTCLWADLNMGLCSGSVMEGSNQAWIVKVIRVSKKEKGKERVAVPGKYLKFSRKCFCYQGKIRLLAQHHLVSREVTAGLSAWSEQRAFSEITVIISSDPGLTWCIQLLLWVWISPSTYPQMRYSNLIQLEARIWRVGCGICCLSVHGNLPNNTIGGRVEYCSMFEIKAFVFSFKFNLQFKISLNITET